MNNLIIITENKPDGKVIKAVVTDELLERILLSQNEGGFKRYSVDTMDETEATTTVDHLNIVLHMVLGTVKTTEELLIRIEELECLNVEYHTRTTEMAAKLCQVQGEINRLKADKLGRGGYD